MGASGAPAAGKTVLITGGASGIGLETVRRLARRGMRVAILDCDADAAEAAATAIGSGTVAFAADVTDADALSAAVEAAIGELGGLDVVMANAGVARWGMVRSMDPDAWEQVIAVNVLGVYRTVRATLPSLVERRGYVLVVASIAAASAVPGVSAYCTSKAGIENFANTLRLEVAHLGVDVGVAYYTWIGTPLVRDADEVSAFAWLRQSLRTPLNRTYPVAGAVDATVAGIERRARRVMYPGWVRQLLAARGPVGRLAERDLLAVVPELDRLSTEEIARVGAPAAALPPAKRAAAMRATPGRSGRPTAGRSA